MLYTPKRFSEDNPDILIGFMQRSSFALLVTVKEGSPVGTHLPVHVEDNDLKGLISGHVARANDQWRHFDGESEAMIVFQ
jgi:transcriptional regulator